MAQLVFLIVVISVAINIIATTAATPRDENVHRNSSFDMDSNLDGHSRFERAPSQSKKITAAQCKGCPDLVTRDCCTHLSLCCDLSKRCPAQYNLVCTLNCKTKGTVCANGGLCCPKSETLSCCYTPNPTKMAVKVEYSTLDHQKVNQAMGHLTEKQQGLIQRQLCNNEIPKKSTSKTETADQSTVEKARSQLSTTQLQLVKSKICTNDRRLFWQTVMKTTPPPKKMPALKKIPSRFG